jgi:hypothetical protein
MKRRVLSALIILVVIGAALTGGILIRTHLNSASSVSIPASHLFRTPHSAYRYQLCEEAYAYEMPNAAESPYKTDDTFPDPFRQSSDTIVPSFLGFDWRVNAISFNVKIEIGQVATYTETIKNIQRLDGISIMLPDTHNRLQRSSVPQFIVSDIEGSSGQYMAILDYTCPYQWRWSVMPT